MLKKYCIYFNVSRGERAEYNYWVCFVRLRMIEDWLFVMNSTPVAALGSQVKRETTGGGVCEMKLYEGGRLSHIFWQTREQVRTQRS